MERVDGRDVCPDCLEEYYDTCSDCGGYCHNDDMHRVIDKYGEEVWVCDDCFKRHYVECDHCGEVFHEDLIVQGHDADGDDVSVCEGCYEQYYEQFETANDDDEEKEAV